MRKVCVQLTGGLGNQLFQYSAALSISAKDSCELFVEQDLGKPRGSIANSAEILTFQLPLIPQALNSSRLLPRVFMERVVGYSLRTGIKRNKFESIKIVRKAQNLVSAILISISIRTPVKLQTGEGVGRRSASR